MLPVKLVFVGNQIDAGLMGLDVVFDLLLLVDCAMKFMTRAAWASAESYQCACALYHGDGQLPARAAAVLMGAPCVARDHRMSDAFAGVGGTEQRQDHVRQENPRQQTGRGNERLLQQTYRG